MTVRIARLRARKRPRRPQVDHPSRGNHDDPSGAKRSAPLSSTESASVTVLLERVSDGDEVAVGQLYDAVYPTLKRLARRELSGHRRDTLCTTDLVHETYLKLLGPGQLERLAGRGHLYAAAAQAMRHVLIDYARKRNADKRGGGWQQVSLDDGVFSTEQLSAQVLALDSALNRLEQADERSFKIVMLKFFAGCSIEEVAAHLDTSAMTVKRGWRKARAYLYATMVEDG